MSFQEPNGRRILDLDALSKSLSGIASSMCAKTARSGGTELPCRISFPGTAGCSSPDNQRRLAQGIGAGELENTKASEKGDARKSTSSAARVTDGELNELFGRRPHALGAVHHSTETDAQPWTRSLYTEGTFRLPLEL